MLVDGVSSIVPQLESLKSLHPSPLGSLAGATPNREAVTKAKNNRESS